MSSEEARLITSMIQDARDRNKEVMVFWDLESALFAGCKEEVGCKSFCGAWDSSFVLTEIYPASLMLQKRIKEQCKALKVKVSMGLCSAIKKIEQKALSRLLSINEYEIPHLSTGAEFMQREINLVIRQRQNNSMIVSDVCYYSLYKKRIYNSICDHYPNLSKGDKEKLRSILYGDKRHSPSLFLAVGRRMPKMHAIFLYALDYCAKNGKGLNIIFIDNDAEYFKEKEISCYDKDLLEKLGCGVETIAITATRSIDESKKYQGTAPATLVEDILSQFEKNMKNRPPAEESRKELLELDIKLLKENKRIHSSIRLKAIKEKEAELGLVRKNKGISKFSIPTKITSAFNVGIGSLASMHGLQ